MSQPEPIRVTIKMYDDEKYVELPFNYDIFIKSILSMLGIEENLLETFTFSYQNNSDLKVYFIKNEDDYILFLKTCAENKTQILNVHLASDIETKNEINANEDKIEIKEISSNKNYKESFIEDEKEERDNNIISNQNHNIIEIKQDSGNILNNIEENENLEYSLLGENNNISEKNNNNKIKINNKNNQNINKNENEIIYNEINASLTNANSRIICNICKQSKQLNIINIIYFCKDCQIFFCDTCEVDIGKNHEHCYYKIKNNKQYQEISDKIQQSGNKFDNFNKDLNNSIINNGSIIENSVKGIIDEGSKFIGSIKNSIKNFFGSNENENNNQNYNNPNELYNPYQMNNNKQNNFRNISDNNQLKILVAQAKSKYNLSDISDIDIERALSQHNGNIDEAASMLLMNKDL